MIYLHILSPPSTDDDLHVTALVRAAGDQDLANGAVGRYDFGADLRARPSQGARLEHSTDPGQMAAIPQG